MSGALRVQDWLDEWIDLYGDGGELFLPSQVDRHWSISGNERLMLAVLADALLDYSATFDPEPDTVRRLFSPGSRVARRLDILRWVRGAPATILFEDIVTHFDIPPAKVWRKLRSYKDTA